MPPCALASRVETRFGRQSTATARIGEHQVASDYTLVETVSTRIPNGSQIVRGAANWNSHAADAPSLVGNRDVGLPVTDHRSSWVRKVVATSGCFYVKTYDYPRLSDRWRGALRTTGPWTRSRAAREYDALAWMRDSGFVAPQPIAALEWRRLGWLHRAVLIVAAFPGEAVDRLLPTLGPANRRSLAKAIGTFVARLHQAGFRDRNLDLRNLLAASDPAGEWVVVKIDSPRHLLRRPGGQEDRWTRADWQRLLPQLAAFGVADAAVPAAT